MRHLPALRRLWLPLAVAVVAIAACDAETPPNGETGPGPASLAGTHWAVAAADALTAPVPGREPTVVFGAGTASGTGGCNSFSGTYVYDPATGAIAFRDLSMTAMACLDHPLNNFERAFFEGLGAAQRLQGTELQLVISGPGHRFVLVPLAAEATG